MLEFISLILLAATILVLISLLRPNGWIEFIVLTANLAVAYILCIGYITSFFLHLSSLSWWVLIQSVCLILMVAMSSAFISFNDLPRRLWHSLPCIRILRFEIKKSWETFWQISVFQFLMVTLPLITCVVLGIINLYIIINYAPHNIDGLTYHLPRIGYFLQNDSLAPFSANYWAQTIHPRNSAILLAYTFLISQNENLFQLPQFLAYCFSLAAMYGIGRSLFAGRREAMFISLGFGLLIEVLLQATTAQNDLLITFYTASSLFFLLSFVQQRDRRSILLAAMPLGISLGTKASFLLILPSILLVAIASLGLFQSRRFKYIGIFSLGCFISFMLFTLPSGYISNLKTYGHPVGPEYVRTMHSFEGKSPAFIIKNGTKNILRFGFDAFSLDSPMIPPLIKEIHRDVRNLAAAAVAFSGVDLTTDEASRVPFRYEKILHAQEDLSYWGIMGFGLCLPLVFMSLVLRNISPRLKLFSLAAVIFVMCQAYSGPYDPWRGRYFIALAPFALPAIGLCFRATRSVTKFYIVFIVLAVCTTAFLAVLFRTDRSLMKYEENFKFSFIKQGGRLEQMLAQRNTLLPDALQYENLVEPEARVAVAFIGNRIEYPLFGKHLKRTVIPVNPFDQGLQPVPRDTDYLVFTANVMKPQPGDIKLGNRWWLRNCNSND